MFKITGTVLYINNKGTRWAKYLAVLFATKKSSKEDVISIAILSSKSGYSKFKMTDDLKLVIDPNRYLDKQIRTRLRMQNIQYITVE